MDFRSMNDFNAAMNAVSGNFLPMSGEKINLGFVRTAYLIFTWIVEAIYVSSTTIGLVFYVPVVAAVRDGGVSAIILLEIFILIPYLSRRGDRLRKIVGKINGILVDSDVMRRCVRDSVEPHKKRLRIYVLSTIVVVTMWPALPMVKLLNGNQTSFYYTDFVISTWYPGAPFTPDVFFWGIVMEIIGAVYLFIKKSGVDVYVCYIITLLIAQYRYVHDELTSALDRNNSEENEELVIDKLKKCVRHHCIVMEIGRMITELLSINVGLTYMNSIVRFCFAGLSLVTLPNIGDRVISVLFLSGTLTQVYFLCLCVQELLDASTTVTDDAFHGDWYGRGSTVKSIFRTMGLGNKVECRLNAFRIVDLTVPTFSSILNGAYSVFLLMLGAL